MSIMKKFNSFLAIAAIALTSVFGFTSCDKNDDVLNGQPDITNTPGTSTTDTDTKENKGIYECNYFVSDNVLSLGDFEITVEQDGEPTTYKVSEGQTAVETFNNADRDNFKSYQLAGHRLIIDNLKDGAKVNVKFVPNEDAISALPADGTITFGILRNIDGSKSSTSNFGEYELPNSQFMQYMNNAAKAASYNF